MPIYKEVTVPMEEYGVDLDMELLDKTNEEIKADLARNHSFERYRRRRVRFLHELWK